MPLDTRPSHSLTFAEDCEIVSGSSRDLASPADAALLMVAAPEWALVKSPDGRTHTPFEVIRENKRHVWLKTGLGEIRYTKREAGWRFPTREAAWAVECAMQDDATAFLKAKRGEQ